MMTTTDTTPASLGSPRFETRGVGPLNELGYFADERVELPAGAITKKSPQDVKHSRVIQCLTKLFYALIGGRAEVSVQAPFALDQDNELEPDLAIVAPRRRANILLSRILIIEVAGSSLAKDRGIKGQLYASANIAEYWVVNLAAEVIEVCTSPKAGSYSGSAVYKSGESIALGALYPQMAKPCTCLLLKIKYGMWWIAKPVMS